MLPGSRKCDKLLDEINCRWEFLTDSLKDNVSRRNYYLSKNENNEKELQRLVQIKENLTYVKDVLLQDLYKSNVNAGKRKKKLNKRLEEFNEKSCSKALYLENIPSVCQLQEIVQSNEKLLGEHVMWDEALVKLKEDYSKVLNLMENKLQMKIIEFVKELSQLIRNNR